VSDYRVKITIRNNRLLEALEKKGYIHNNKPSVLKFCRAHKLSYIGVNLVFSGKVSPLRANGQLTPTAKEVLDCLDLRVEQAFTERQLKGFNKNSYEFKAKEQELMQITNNQSLELRLMQSQTDKIINQIKNTCLFKLGKKHIMVWDGINDGQTLQQLADKLNVSRERVRQMYEYSQRKVKQSLLARKSNLLNAGLKQVYPKVDLQ